MPDTNSTDKSKKEEKTTQSWNVDGSTEVDFSLNINGFSHINHFTCCIQPTDPRYRKNGQILVYVAKKSCAIELAFTNNGKNICTITRIDYQNKNDLVKHLSNQMFCGCQLGDGYPWYGVRVQGKSYDSELNEFSEWVSTIEPLMGKLSENSY